MIRIKSKEQCCGCSACLHICPKHSISFVEDREGFLYPEIDGKICIDCGLCEQVCPVLNQNSASLPLKVFAAKHPDDEIRMSSSSGGIFTLLAEQIIDEGGVVFGAKFNENWEVVHDYAETKEGLVPFRGSKYVQSKVGDAYVSVERFLKTGRKVMFTGTPCQVAGLKKFLRKEYENFLAVDFVCHGVPSPLVWRKYLAEEAIRHKNALLTRVNFRDKSTGWKNSSFALRYSNLSGVKETNIVVSSVFYENQYMNAFLSDLILRPSCYACPAKSGKSQADITIGDFWGIDFIDTKFDDDKGVGVVLINTQKGEKLHNSLLAISNEMIFDDVLKFNPYYCRSCKPHPNRKKFFQRLDNVRILSKHICRMQQPALNVRLINLIKKYIKALLSIRNVAK